MKILLDMNLSPSWKNLFLENRMEAVHWSEIGKPNAPDTEIFHYAREKKYIVFTHDLDFGAILAATNADFPSVIQIRDVDITPSHMSSMILEVIGEYKEHLEKGALLSVDKKKSRIHILPLRS